MRKLRIFSGTENRRETPTTDDGRNLEKPGEPDLGNDELETTRFEEDDTEELEAVEAIEYEITDVLDLHVFPPKEVKALVRDYLDLAYERGFRELRIIHGKGRGVQRRIVRSILEKDPRVVEFGDPPGGVAGGWGATVVRMQ